MEKLITFKIIFWQRSSETKNYSFLNWEHIWIKKVALKTLYQDEKGLAVGKIAKKSENYSVLI